MTESQEHHSTALSLERPPDVTTLPTRRRSRTRGRFGRRLWQYRVPLAFAVPGLAFYLLFYYVPLLGNIVAFQNYLPFLGFLHSDFVGFTNFTTLFHDQLFWKATLNTLEITVLQLVLYFPAPIILALLLNAVTSNGIRRVVQSIIYLPHFMSWVVVVILFQEIFGGSGLLDQYLRNHGDQNPINLMTDPRFFKALLTVQVIWKDTGWGTIIFFAALVAIDISLYEAAAVDGANG
ncbi:MAG: sugar ABC transporter permease, partial [Mycobacterium sp.]|nr:sugar ABC transporter permease [Mycobacterium sp.]